MPASPIELKNSLPDLDLNPGRREPSARQNKSQQLLQQLLQLQLAIYQSNGLEVVIARHTSSRRSQVVQKSQNMAKSRDILEPA